MSIGKNLKILDQTKDNLKEQNERAPSQRYFLEEAEKLRKENRLEDAMNILKEGLKNFPQYLPLKVSLGKLYLETKNWEKSIEIFNEVIQRDKENTIAIRSLAVAYEEKGDFLEAIKKYKFLRVFFPQDEGLQNKIKELELILNPPITKKELKIQKFKKFLNKINKRNL